MSEILPTPSFFTRMFGLVIEKLNELKPKEIQQVKIITEPYKTTKTVIKRISTVVTTEPNNPQIKIEAPTDSDIRITSITLIPDASFKTKGILRLLINDVEELLTVAGDLTDYSTLNIPITNEGKELQRSKSIKLFAWTSDGTASAITLQASFAR